MKFGPDYSLVCLNNNTTTTTTTTQGKVILAVTKSLKQLQIRPRKNSEATTGPQCTHMIFIIYTTTPTPTTITYGIFYKVQWMLNDV